MVGCSDEPIQQPPHSEYEARVAPSLNPAGGQGKESMVKRVCECVCVTDRGKANEFRD